MYSVPISDPRRIKMPPRETCCCFTGHRKLPWPLREKLAQRLDLEIAWLAEHGCTNFIAGGALVFDTIAAEAVLRAHRNDPAVRLYLFLPSPVQTSGWAWDDCERYQDICDAADAVHVLGTNHSAGCMMQRNRAMVETGQAVAYGDYRDAEMQARTERKGLWKSSFDRPQDWRKMHQQDIEAPPEARNRLADIVNGVYDWVREKLGEIW